VFAFLRALENHVDLIRGTVEPGTLTRDGAQIRLHGPFGLRRTVRTQMSQLHSPDSIVGGVEAGSATRGTVSWSIEPSDSGSRVEVAACSERLGMLDRVLLGAGGERWLCRSLRVALARLERRMADAELGTPILNPSAGAME
jgi:hypothetical protein